MRVNLWAVFSILLLSTVSNAEIYECSQNAFAFRDFTVFNDLNKWCGGTECPKGQLFQAIPTSSFKSLEHRKYLIALNKDEAPSLKIIRSVSEEGETASENILLKTVSRDPQSGAILMTHVSDMGNQLFSIILSPKLKKMIATEVSFIEGVRGKFRTFDCQ